MPQTREQRRARNCWFALETRFGPQNKWKDKASKYLGHLRKTAARIHLAGLGQALAFLLSRKGDSGTDARHAANDVGRLVLLGVGEQPPECIDKSADALLEKLRDEQTTWHWYTLSTREAEVVIAWLTRYLEGAGVEAKEEGE